MGAVAIPSNAAGLRVAHGAHDGFVRRMAGIGGEHARRERLLGSVKERLAHRADAAIGHRLARDLGTDAGGVAGGDTDAWVKTC